MWSHWKSCCFKKKKGQKKAADLVKPEKWNC